MLTPRLRIVADYVKKDSIVGDIGSDHGYLVVDLIQRGIIKKAIASDLNQGPVDNAKRNIYKYGLEEDIKVRLGGGLTPYKAGEIDTAIICGMGGILIADILEESKRLWDSIEHFILQPMNYQDYLRAYLQKNGFKLIDESIVREGEKFYQVFSYTRGEMDEFKPLELIYGKNMLKDTEDSKAFIKKEVKKINIIKKNLKNSDSEASKERVNELNNQLLYLEGF